MTTTKIAYLGPSGTYSEKAAKKMNAIAENPEWVTKGTIEDVLYAVSRSEANIGVVPIRTHYGDVGQTIDMLHEATVLSEKGEGARINVTGYTKMPILFYLAAKNGAELSGIKREETKKEAIDACAKDLAKLIPGYQSDYLESTAGGALKVANSGYEVATLCTEEAMRANGLESLIPEPIRRETAFVSVADKSYHGFGSSMDWETMVMVRLYHDRPGLLHDMTGAVQPINIRDVHLIKDREDMNGKAGLVFMLRINADPYQAIIATNAINGTFAKEELYVPGVLPPRVTNLGSYAVIP